MSIKEDVIEMKKSVDKMKEQSWAMTILSDYKKANKRLFTILLVVLSMWFVTIGAFVYYISTVDYIETEEIADTGEGGNACVGDNCNNGEINYGKGN